MKKLLGVLLLCLGCADLAPPEATAQALGGGLEQVTTFGSNPGALNMWRYVPSGMPQNAPLVLVLHGCSQQAADIAQVGFNALADQWKFYVLYPEQRSANNALTCFNWAGEYGDPTNLKRDQGENASIKQMIDQMKADFSIDPSRVFITGFSGGGAQTALMLAVWPDVFAAGATVAGIPYNCTTTFSEVSGCLNPGKDKTPAQWGDHVRAVQPGYAGPWPRVAILQGTADGFVKPMNQLELLEQWSNVHGVDTVADETAMVGKHVRKAYQDGSGRTVVETLEIAGMDHGFPVDPGAGCGQAGTYRPSVGLCGAEYIARFFGLDGPGDGPSGTDGGGGGDAGAAGGDGGPGGGPSGDGGQKPSGGRDTGSGGGDPAPVTGCATAGVSPGGVTARRSVALLLALAFVGLVVRRRRRLAWALVLAGCAAGYQPPGQGDRSRPGPGVGRGGGDDAGGWNPSGDGGSTQGWDGAIPPPDGEPYAHASEAVHGLEKALDLSGPFGVAATGGHLLASNASGGHAFPRNTPISSKASVTIPAGAMVKHALLWYGGAIFMKPAAFGQGDYTADVGGPLDTAADVAANGITFHLDGKKHGPYDPSKRPPPGASSLGHATQLSPIEYNPHFGTWTGVNETVWANRLDVTGAFAGLSGTIEVTVDPPERLDPHGNDALKNGGNPAGSTLYNLCSGGASWSLLVIYEQPGAPAKNLVLLDGDFARAWDYLFFHSGKWQRPKIRIDHAPMRPGARFFLAAGSGAPAGEALPSSPTCSCGCGGQYTLAKTGLLKNAFFSDTYTDPPECVSDPLHRDKTNGPWYVATGKLPIGVVGNDWTLFQSGAVYTELPNLYEGQEAPEADGREPVTHEDDPDPSKDVYGGHPWTGRGAVKYHAYGNALTVVEVTPDVARLTPNETTSYLYLKGDQKDVWKPQAIVSVKWILFETPLW